MSDTIFLTGGTGFLGMELIAHLLERDEGPEIVVGVRAEDGEAADARLSEILDGLYEEAPASAKRVRAVCADLNSEGLGLSSGDRRALVADVDRVVHCAASVAFTLPLEEAREINVEGTRQVLDLAREIDALERFVHVSTAYVCGRRAGSFTEYELPPGNGFRNTYEQTKLEGEHLVDSVKDLPRVVVRPSVVVGESQGGWTSSFNVIYWPLQAFARGLFEEVAADPDGIIDLVPVDHVAKVIERAALDPAAGGNYHAVAGDNAMTVSELINKTCHRLDREPPRLTEPGEVAEDHPAAVFAPYFDVRTRFDDRRARALVGAPDGAPKPETYFPALLDYGLKTRWGKNPQTRQQVRAEAGATAVA